jgi:uncharacterized protein YegL
MKSLFSFGKKLFSGGGRKNSTPQAQTPKTEEIKTNSVGTFCGVEPRIKNGITELVFIIDKSGSMSGFEADTIGGFNSMIEQQKALEGDVRVTTVFFSGTDAILHDREKICDIKPMTREQYTVGGCTALLDAIGNTINHIDTIHKYARPEDVPEKTIFLITTDGFENASKCFSSDDIKKSISLHEAVAKWEFLFVAANIDAVETARNIGISEDRAANYRQDSKGTADAYSAMSCAVSAMRESRPCTNEWKKKLGDF